MAAEYDLNQFNSHKNIASKEMWEKKVKIKQKHKMYRSSALIMPTSPGPSTSNNWGWADIFKKTFYTCRI
jgi:hypothetical protein